MFTLVNTRGGPFESSEKGLLGPLKRYSIVISSCLMDGTQFCGHASISKTRIRDLHLKLESNFDRTSFAPVTSPLPSVEEFKMPLTTSHS